ncbi:MAG TPA: hypothetical protein VFJ06_07760 [Halococcus sp.]|nr:hypothetical protein [Halococcus sp.]
MPENQTTDAETEAEERNTEYVAQSRKRTAVLGRLVEGPAEPAEIATGRSMGVTSAQSVTGSLSVSNAQNTAEELRERGFVELLVTEDKRVYTLTAKGEETLFLLERSNEI